MEENILQLEKSQAMDAFLKEHKISKYIRKNITIDYPSVLQANVIPVIKQENNVIIQYTPPSGIKLTYLLPLLTMAIKRKSKGNPSNFTRLILKFRTERRRQ